MNIGWDMICSAITATTAIAALLVSVAQMRLSNKQQLLDRRLHLWIKARGLMELCKSNRPSLEKKACEPVFDNDIVFQWMTNNSLLCDIGPAIAHVLEQDWQCRLLAKLEELKEAAFEAELVFKGRPAEALSSFIADYASLLMSMYQYQIMLENLYETSEKFHYDLNQAISAVDEERQRDELYKARDKLLNSFDGLAKDAAGSIVVQCKLPWLS